MKTELGLRLRLDHDVELFDPSVESPVLEAMDAQYQAEVSV